MDTNVKDKRGVDRAKAALRGLSERETREVVSDALTNMPAIGIPTFCPIFVQPTDFENDLDTIMDRVTISTQIGNFDGNNEQTLNAGETFTLTATVKNCSKFELADVELTASSAGPRFQIDPVASVVGDRTEVIGVLRHGQSRDVKFSCIANRATDGNQPLIKLSLDATPVFEVTTDATADGEIAPPD